MFRFESFINNTACITSDGRSVTYGELDELARRIGKHVKPHSLVFCLCSNTIGSIAGYVAFMGNDDASLLLDCNISKDSFDSLAEIYHPGYIWAPSHNNGYTFAKVLFEAYGYTLYKTNDCTPVADELAVLIATSGSTGSPKLVRLSKKNLYSNALSIIEYLHITEQERPILGLPMNYAYGLSIINSHLIVGATLLLSETSFVEREFWQFANDNKFTSYSGVPYAYETIKRLKIWKLEMPTLRTLTQAGGTLSKEYIRFLDEAFSPRGVKLFVMYGQAEATARISYLNPDFLKTKIGSIGKAIPGGEISLIDENGDEITDHDTTGELVYSGPNVSLGYAVCIDDLMKGDENHGTIHTGDLAYQDGDGFYYIAGRKGRFIKLLGIRISLDHVETLLKPIMTECACVGDDSQLVVFTSDVDYDEDRVIDLLSSRTMIPRKAFKVLHVDKIPRSETGKVLYYELNKIWNTK